MLIRSAIASSARRCVLLSCSTAVSLCVCVCVYVQLAIYDCTIPTSIKGVNSPTWCVWIFCSSAIYQFQSPTKFTEVASVLFFFFFVEKVGVALSAQVISEAWAAAWGFQCLLISRTHARARPPPISACLWLLPPHLLPLTVGGLPPAKELCRGKWKAVEQE